MSKWVAAVQVPEEPAKPDVYEDWQKAFRRLSNSRQCGMAANRLIFADVCGYFDRVGKVFCSDFALFVDVLQAMDSIYLDWVEANKSG